MSTIANRLEPVIIEGGRIVFRNFEGREGQYNRKGDRNFGVLLDAGVARVMEEDGWNIKYLRPREEGDEPQAWLPVSVGFEVRPPVIFLITRRGRTKISEDELEILDWVDILSVDLSVRPYTWNVGGRSGVKAYLKSMYITIQEDPLEIKYEDVLILDQLPARAGRTDEGREIADRPHYDYEGEIEE